MTPRHQLWAVPAAEARVHLETVVLDLARRHDGPRFLPHLTLFAGVFDDPAALLRVARDEAARVAPFALAVRRVAPGPSFTRCVVVELGSHDAARALTEAARVAARPGDFVLEPHLSLLYATPSADERARIASGVALPWDHIPFAELVVNASPGPVRARADVEAWTPLLRLPLSGT